MLTDITERRATEDLLWHAALHERLTGLPNRSLFGDRLSHALAARRSCAVTVMLLACRSSEYRDCHGFHWILVSRRAAPQG